MGDLLPEHGAFDEEGGRLLDDADGSAFDRELAAAVEEQVRNGAFIEDLSLRGISAHRRIHGDGPVAPHGGDH